MLEYTIHLTTGEYITFIGKYRRDLETDNWHYYEKQEGTIIHLRKEHIIYVSGDTADNIIANKPKTKADQPNTTQQFKIYGKARIAKKKELSRINKIIKDFWKHWQISNLMYTTCDHQNPIDKQEAMNIYTNLKSEADSITNELNIPYNES